MDRRHLALVAALAAVAAASASCGSKSDVSPRIASFSATLAWTPSIVLSVEVSDPNQDLSGVYVASARPDGTLIGSEHLILGAPLGDTLAGQPSISATRTLASGGVAPGRMRLRAVDAQGHEAIAFAAVAHPSFGVAGAACSGVGQPCAGELGCDAGTCAAPAGTSSACAAAVAPTWIGGVAELPVPSGTSGDFVGTCSAGPAHADAVYALVLDAPGGERLDIEPPVNGVALLRSDCAAPSTEMICVTSADALTLDPGTYFLVIDATGSAGTGVVRITRTPL